jgi:hypothetical protein
VRFMKRRPIIVAAVDIRSCNNDTNALASLSANAVLSHSQRRFSAVLQL